MNVTELVTVVTTALSGILIAYFALKRGQSQDRATQGATDEKQLERLLNRVDTLEKRLDLLQDKYQRALELLAADRASPGVRNEIKKLLKNEE